VNQREGYQAEIQSNTAHAALEGNERGTSAEGAMEVLVGVRSGPLFDILSFFFRVDNPDAV